ncbi:Choline dehydrogenase [Ascochyta lentis]
MISGIGPAVQLNKVNIHLIADRRGVGQNMQDHIFLSSLVPPTATKSKRLPSSQMTFSTLVLSSPWTTASSTAAPSPSQSATISHRRKHRATSSLQPLQLYSTNTRFHGRKLNISLHRGTSETSPIF